MNWREGLAKRRHNLNITIIATSGIYPLHIGGPANVGYFLAKEFGKNDHDVTMFVRVKNKEDIQLIKNLPEFTELINVNIVPIEIEYNIRTFLNIPLLTFKIISATRSFIRHKCDVVLYNSPPVDVMLLVPLISKLIGARQFLILHGGLFNERKNYIGRALIRMQISYFEKIVAISSYSEEIAKRIGVRDEKIAIINNGVDLSEYSNLSKLTLGGDPKLLYVGRLAPIKGVDVLIKAFKIVHEQLPDSRLYLVGDGPEKDNLVSLANELGIYDSIDFIGYIPPSETLYRYYITCQMLILPSHIENFPITLLEAMYLKTPVIATKIKGGVTELIKDEVNGLLVEPGNSIELAQSIIELTHNKKMQENFVEYNHSLIQTKYTWEIIGNKYLDMFKKECL